MFLGDLCAPLDKPSAPCGVDQLPGLFTGGILEGAAARLHADRLRRFAIGFDLFQFLGDRDWVARLALEQSLDKDPVLGSAAVAIAEPEVAQPDLVRAALAIEGGRFDQDSSHVTAIGTGIHAQGAADRPRDTRQELQATEACCCRCLSHIGVEHGRADADPRSLDRETGKASAQAQGDTRQTAIADQQIGADTEHAYRDIDRKSAKHGCQILGIDRAEHHFRRPAHTEPGDRGQRGVRGQSAADFRHTLDQGQAGDNVGVLLRGIKREEIERGQVLAKPGSITPHTKFEGEVYVLTKEEGGRHTPFFKGYRPQFYFRTTDVTGTIELPGDTEMVMPGDNIKMTVELLAPIAMEDGLRFAIREGGRTVGAGVVAKILK